MEVAFRTLDEHSRIDVHAGRARSGANYCASLAPAPPIDDPRCAFGAYVSNIPITLIQEVVGGPESRDLRQEQR